MYSKIRPLNYSPTKLYLFLTTFIPTTIYEVKVKLTAIVDLSNMKSVFIFRMPFSTLKWWTSLNWVVFCWLKKFECLATLSINDLYSNVLVLFWYVRYILHWSNLWFVCNFLYTPYIMKTKVNNENFISQFFPGG